FQCPKCGEFVPLFDCPTVEVEYTIVEGRGRTKAERKKCTVCPHCYAENHKRARPEFVISTRQKRFGEKPVMVAYACKNGCRPKSDSRGSNFPGGKKSKYFAEVDLPRIQELA